MQTVISAFDDYPTAQRAVDRLTEAGFSRDDVHIEAGAGSSASTRTTATADRTDSEYGDRGVLSSIGHFFTSLFGMDSPSTPAAAFAEAVRRGGSVVVVDVTSDEESDRVASIMNAMGAVDIDERADQWRSSGWTGTQQGEAGRDRIPGEDRELTGREQVMDVVQEELAIGKRQVDRGGVRVIQRVSEKPVRELIKLRDERAVVERRDVDRPASQAELANFVERMEGAPGTQGRGMRERAVASDEPGTLRDTRSERDPSFDSSDPRDTKGAPTRRNT